MIKKHGHWWLPDSEKLGLKWFENERGERPEACDAAIRHCTSFDIALDVGAHVGTWTAQLAKHFRHTFAFEPVYPNWWALLHNLEDRNVPLDRATARLEAVGDRLGNCRPTFMTNASMSSHVDPNIGGRISYTSLDAVQWGHVSLIKIDVEGGEYFVLKGGERILEQDHPVLCIEWKPDRLNRYGDYVGKIETILYTHGYRLAEQLEIDRIYV